MIYQFRSIQ